jgi:hypothetical protein
MVNNMSGQDPSAAYIRELTRDRYSIQSAGLSSYSSFSRRMLGSSRFETL